MARLDVCRYRRRQTGAVINVSTQLRAHKALVTVENSVGRGCSNLPLDVLAIGVSLVAVGVDRGGIFAPPLSVDCLGQAIELFQRTQR